MGAQQADSIPSFMERRPALGPPQTFAFPRPAAFRLDNGVRHGLKG